jgi:hypothetical protein
MCIPGHTGRILGSYLHNMFQSWHSNFVAMMQLENHMLQPCLTVSVQKIFGLFNLDLYIYIFPPDGSNCTFQVFFRLLYSFMRVEISLGARPTLLMVVAPEAIVEECVFRVWLK